MKNTHRTARSILGLVAVAAAGALTLAGCSGDSSAGQDAPAEDGLTPVTLGYIPSTISTALAYIDAEGIFEKHGLDVDMQPNQSGSVMLPAVATGSLDFGMGNVLSVMIAAQQGIDVKLVSGFTIPQTEGADGNGIVVRDDSPIQSWADLEGHSVAVNAVNTLPDMLISINVEDDGGDPANVKFTELPFPNMQEQLEAGGVDAIWTVEPFLSAAADAEGNRLVGYPYPEAMPGLPGNMFFTSGSFAEENPETVKKFQDAIAEGLEQATANIDDVRALMPETLEVTPEVAETVAIDQLTAEVDHSILEEFVTEAVRFGRLEEPIDVESLFVQ